MTDRSPPFSLVGIDHVVFIAHAVLWIAAALTVWTGWEYLRSTWPHLAGPEI